VTYLQEPVRLDNQYLDDRPLRALLRRVVPTEALRDIEPELIHVGELAGGAHYDLALEHRTSEPEHVPFDAWGRRIDEVRVSPAWKRFAADAARLGLVSAAYERRHGAHSRLHQLALVYLFDRSTQTYTCPLAMTDGAARTLETLADDELRQRVLPHLISRDPAEAWTSGQWMTERIGGSDVGQTETIAKKTPEGWRLHGVKWFTSAVTSQVALTLARPEGNPAGGKGLALFLVNVRDAKGALNGITVHRLKEKLGTRHLPTAELTLDGTLAMPLKGLHDGIRHMGSMLDVTRTWNTVASVASMRRGLALARDFAGRRRAFGSLLRDKPLHNETLATLAAEHEAALQLTFFVAGLVGRNELRQLDDAGAALLRTLVPIAKLLTARQAVAAASEVVEAFGGAGYIEDTGVPQLLRDTQVLSIWEGTTNVLSLETYRALQRTAALPHVIAEAERQLRTAKDPRLVELGPKVSAALASARRFYEAHAGDDVGEAAARRFAVTVGRAMSLALLVAQAQWSLDTDHDARSLVAARRFAALGLDYLAGFDEDLAGAHALAADQPLFS
jgi:acyl-CoA dehydrogenase